MPEGWGNGRPKGTMLQTSRMVLGASSKLTLIAWGEGVPVAALFFKIPQQSSLK